MRRESFVAGMLWPRRRTYAVMTAAQDATVRRRPQGLRYTPSGSGVERRRAAVEVTPKQTPISRGKLALSMKCPVGPADEPQQGADRCAERTERPQEKVNGVGAQQQ